MGNIVDDRLDLSDLKYADLSPEQEAKTCLRRGDILFNRTNSIDKVGKVALVKTADRLSFASYLIRLRTNHRTISDWLYHRLSAADFQARIRSLATKGVSQANVNPTKFRDEVILLPPLPEQRKIAAILSSVDEAIEKTQAVIDQVQVVKKGLMQELLTKGLPEQRASRTKGITMPLGNVATITTGGTPSRLEPAYWGGHIPWVKTGEVNYSGIRKTDEYLTDRGIEESAAKLLPPGTNRDQRKRWASCDEHGVLRFNWRVIQAPMRLVDYVVAHELVHLRHRDHTKAFWARLGSAMPDYERRKEELRRLGPRLHWQ